MTEEKKNRLTVVTNNSKAQSKPIENEIHSEFHSNPFYEKLLNFRNLQEQQKKRFSVDDLFKLC